MRKSLKVKITLWALLAVIVVNYVTVSGFSDKWSLIKWGRETVFCVSFLSGMEIVLMVFIVFFVPKKDRYAESR